MKDLSATRQLEPPTLEQFRAFVKKIVSVPKAELEKAEKTYKQRRKMQKRKVTVSTRGKV
jgi:hypothetical protein